MAPLAGKGGKVSIGAADVAFVEDWTFDISDEALETTGLGATSRAFIGRGLPTGTGTINFRALDNSDTATAALRAAAIDNSTALAVKLYESATKYWGFNAIVTNMGQTTPVDDKVTGSFSFTATGAIAYN